MPVLRSRITLLDLPVDLLLDVADKVLASDVQEAMRLRELCIHFRDQMEDMADEQSERKLAWLPHLSRGCDIGPLQASWTGLRRGGDSPWAVCRRLSTSGVSRWTVRIEGGHGQGTLVGVCNSSATCGWGLHPAQGGTLEVWGRCENSMLYGADVPAGFPNGHRKHAMLEPGITASTDTLVEVVVDADAGTLAFGVNGGKAVTVLSGFPRGEALRPWTCQHGYSPDKVVLATPFI